jgi:hypothetical protein
MPNLQKMKYASIAYVSAHANEEEECCAARRDQRVRRQQVEGHWPKG